MRSSLQQAMWRTSRWLALSLILILGQAIAGQKLQDANQTGGQTYQEKDLSIEFSLIPSKHSDKAEPGDLATAIFKITDAHQHIGVSKLLPRAWLIRQSSGDLNTEADCEGKVRNLINGGLSSRANVDLNSYTLVTLNHDKTVSFINPLVAFSASKMENIIALPGVGSDWVVTPDNRFIYISIPEQALIAVIDATTRKLSTTIAIGKGSKPNRLLMQPNGQYLWVGIDQASTVIAIDTASNSVTAMMPVGLGLHTLEITSDQRLLYITNSTDDTVTAIDVQKMAVMDTIKLGKTPVAIAYGEASRQIYVADLNGGNINVIDPESQKVRAVIPARPGIVAIRFDPSGRFAFAVNQVDSSVSVIDSAINKIIVSGKVVKEPDQIIYTDQFAYIRGLGTEKFSLIDLANARKGVLQPTDIQAGQLPPEQEAEQVNVAPMMAVTPDNNSIMIANAPDRLIYFYQEGMMAPMGTFSNYKRIPRGLMILDQSLKETEPGTYSAAVKLPNGGRFDVPFVLDRPRIVHCFQTSVVDPNGTQNHNLSDPKKMVITLLDKEKPFFVKRPQTIRLSIFIQNNKTPMTGLKVLKILSFKPPGTDRQEHILRENNRGEYASDITFHNAGLYKVLFSLPEMGFNWVDLPSLEVNVNATPENNNAKAIN